MLIKRASEERGPSNIGWLQSMHTFSFAHYYDRNHMGYGPLRVINDDRVRAGAGFETHPHANMEIISYVIEGEMAHKDSMGNGSSMKAGDVQLMSAGTGVTHSEFNNSNDEDLHFLQIWIVPNAEGGAPSYQQNSFDKIEMKDNFRVVISPDGENSSLTIKQDMRLMVGKFEGQSSVEQNLSTDRKYWLHVVHGDAHVNDVAASSGDGFAIEGEAVLKVTMQSDAEILLFDLPL